MERNKYNRTVLKAGSLLLCLLLIAQAYMRNKEPAILIFEWMFPIQKYESGKYEDALFLKGRTMLWQCLFPGDVYMADCMSRDMKTVIELYPTGSQLNRFKMENRQESMREYDELLKKADEENAVYLKSQEASCISEDENTVSANAGSIHSSVYSMESLLNYDFLMNQFYVVDAATACDNNVICPQTLLERDLTMDLGGDEPKILIYHTHSQEAFADSVEGNEYTTVLGLGDTLAEILKNKYGIEVYHERGVFDMIDGQLDRSKAYSMALPVVENILEAHPSIKVVIDLHRDGVDENTHLVTNINGKPTAKIMFFNGLCRGAVSGTNGFMQNPYLTDNLAFSLQMQLKAAEKYPDFTRRIYLRSYRYNMHVAPRTLLIECGAQTNTVEEVHNAMEPLADILYSVLSGT